MKDLCQTNFLLVVLSILYIILSNITYMHVMSRRPKGGQATRRKRLQPQSAALEEMAARIVAEMETRNINKNDLFDTVDRIMSKRAKK